MNDQVSGSRQMALDFTPGLTERYDTALACVRGCMHQQPRPLKSIAMDMDMSQSDLSRKLSDNPDDPRRFSLGDLEKYIEVTGDITPIRYLAQKYCIDGETRKREALTALAALAPQIEALLKAVV